MRWLVIHPGPDWSVADVFNGWCEALRDLGEQVEIYNLNERITFFDKCLVETGEEQDGLRQVRKALRPHEVVQMAAENVWSVAMRWWPHVILGISAFFTPPLMLDVLRDRGMKVVLLHTESPYQDTEQLERAAHADLNLLNDPANIDAYRALGPAEYMPHAYRPKIHYPGAGDPELACDLAFVGTGFPTRQDFFHAMNLDGLRVKIAGGWPDLPENSPIRDWLVDPEMAGGSDVVSMKCIDNDQAALLYRSAACGINFYRRESEEGRAGQGTTMGPREVEMAACGLFFLRDPRPESDETFPMLPSFDSPGHASDLLRYYLAHDGERERLARKARAAIEHRTFSNNAKRLLRLLEGK